MATTGVRSLMPGEWELQQAQIDRKRKLAEALQQQSQEMPQGQMVSGHFVNASPFQYMAQMLKGYNAKKELEGYDKQQLDLINGEKTKQQNLANQLLSGLKPQEQDVSFDSTGIHGEPTYTQPDYTSAIANYIANGGTNDALVSLAQNEGNYIRNRANTLEDRKANWEHDDVNAYRQHDWQVQGQDAGFKHAEKMQQGQQEFERIQQKERQGFELTQMEKQFANQYKLQQANQSFQAGQNALNRQQQERLATIKNAPDAKPLPAQALKMQQDSVEKMQTARNINTDLAGFAQQIDQGKLDFGPVTNAISKARNWAGASNDQSRNFGSFTSALEKLRNDSLRLNNGVQTEGDAQRAWNELFANINDKQLVRQRLDQIQEINKRAEMLHQMNIDSVRANYGHDPLVVPVIADKPITGSTGSWGAPPPGAVRVKGKK